MASIPPKTSRAITIFSFLATILVVMCHTDDVMPSESRSSLVRYFGGVFSDANVSNFFFLSGFLLARHFHETGWWRKAIVSRLRTLVVPYIAWCIIYFFISGRFLVDAGELHSALVDAGGLMPVAVTFARITRNIFGLGLLTPPCDFVLWYIKTLFYFALVSAVAFPCLLGSKRRFLSSIFFLLAFFVVGHSLHLRIMPYFGFCFHLVGFAAFLAGAYCAIHGIEELPDKLLRFHSLIPLCIWAATAAVCMLISPYIKGISVLVSTFNIAMSVFCMVWISFTVDRQLPKALSKCTFFIYAAHLAVLRVLARLFEGGGWMPSICVFAIFLLVAISSCILGAHIIWRIWPRLAEILTGGRFERKG